MAAVSNHFLVGRPGVGKTTFLLKAAQRLGEVRVAGFFTQEQSMLLASLVWVLLGFRPVSVLNGT